MCLARANYFLEKEIKRLISINFIYIIFMFKKQNLINKVYRNTKIIVLKKKYMEKTY